MDFQKKATVETPPSVGFPWLLALLTAVVTFIAFSPALKNEFVSWDDSQYFLINASYRGLHLANLKWMFTTFYMGQYTPLAWLSSGLDYVLWGMNPMGYHLDSILIHALNSVLFLALAVQIFRIVFPSEARNEPMSLNIAAAVAALLFSIHPLRVESVVWATERRDVLGGFFFILALLWYLRFHNPMLSARRGLPWASLIAFLCALLCKATIMGMPLVLLGLDYYPLHRIGREKGWFRSTLRNVWLEKGSYLVIALPIAYMAHYGQGNYHATYSLQDIGLTQRAALASYSSVFYLWKTFFPTHLSPLYEIPSFVSWQLPIFWMSAGLFVTLTVMLFMKAARWPAVWVAWLSYLILLAPNSGLVPSGIQMAADRFSYFSCMVWPLLIGAGLFQLWRKQGRIFLVAGTLPVLGMLSAETYAQTRVWQTTTSLWAQAVLVNPKSVLAQTHYVDALIESGNMKDVEALLQETLMADPRNPDTLFTLGKLAGRQHNTEKAERYYRQALAINPHHLDAHMNEGLICLNRNQPVEAAGHFRNVIQDDPEYVEAHVNLGIAYAMQHKLDAAISEFRLALKLRPGFVPAEANLAHAMSMLKK